MKFLEKKDVRTKVAKAESGHGSVEAVNLSHTDSLRVKHTPSDLPATTRQPEDFHLLAVEEAKKIYRDLEDADIDRLSPELQQVELKHGIEDLEQHIAAKYSGIAGTVKWFVSPSFRRGYREDAFDLKFAKDAVAVLAVQNRDPFVLPEGVKVPPVMLVERIQKEVDFLKDLRKSVEERIEGRLTRGLLSPLKRKVDLDWMWARDEHHALLKNALGFSSDDKTFDLDEYFKFLEIEHKVIQDKLSARYDLMESCASGGYVDPDFSEMSQDEILRMIDNERELDQSYLYNGAATSVGSQKVWATRRGMDLDKDMFAEAKETFFEKKIEDYIESNKERISELMDTSILLELQTHLGKMDPENPVYELTDKDKEELVAAFISRVGYDARKSLGIAGRMFSDKVGHRSERLRAERLLSEMMMREISKPEFKDVVADFARKCFGKKWEDGEAIYRPESKSAHRIVEPYPGGVVEVENFVNDPNNAGCLTMNYRINGGDLQSLKGLSSGYSWWPHPLGVVIEDGETRDLLLNGKDLISRGDPNVKKQNVSSCPLGIMWTEGGDMFLNGKRAGKAPGGNDDFVGFSRSGPVVRSRDIYIYKSDRREGMYVNGEYFCEAGSTWTQSRAVVSKDFSFVTWSGDGLYLDGKYVIVGSAVPDGGWWVLPQGVVVLDKEDRSLRFCGFDKVKKDADAAAEAARKGEEEKKMAERRQKIKDRIVDTYVRSLWSKKLIIPAKKELEQMVDEEIRKEDGK